MASANCPDCPGRLGPVHFLSSKKERAALSPPGGARQLLLQARAQRCVYPARLRPSCGSSRSEGRACMRVPGRAQPRAP